MRKRSLGLTFGKIENYLCVYKPTYVLCICVCMCLRICVLHILQTYVCTHACLHVCMCIPVVVGTCTSVVGQQQQHHCQLHSAGRQMSSCCAVVQHGFPGSRYAHRVDLSGSGCHCSSSSKTAHLLPPMWDVKMSSRGLGSHEVRCRN